MKEGFDYSNYKLQICKFVYAEHVTRGLIDYGIIPQWINNTITAADAKILCKEIEKETKIFVTKDNGVGMSPDGVKIMKRLGGHPTSYGLIIDAKKTKFQKQKTPGSDSGTDSGTKGGRLEDFLMGVSTKVVAGVILAGLAILWAAGESQNWWNLIPSFP